MALLQRVVKTALRPKARNAMAALTARVAEIAARVRIVPNAANAAVVVVVAAADTAMAGTANLATGKPTEV